MADEPVQYVDCACIVCGSNEGFKLESLTKGMVGGWCEICKRESVFKKQATKEKKE